MKHNSNEETNSVAPSDSFFAVVGKAAEEEMLTECELWERDAVEIQIPEKTEVQILALARKYEKKQLNKAEAAGSAKTIAFQNEHLLCIN